MLIGTPKEIKNNEYRIGLSPALKIKVVRAWVLTMSNMPRLARVS